MKQLTVCIANALLLSVSQGLPRPQSASSAASPSDSDSDSAYDDDYYGDYDETAPQPSDSGDLGDIIKSGSGLVGSLLGLFNQKELRDQVGNTVSSGLDLTGEILRA